MACVGPDGPEDVLRLLGIDLSYLRQTSYGEISLPETLKARSESRRRSTGAVYRYPEPLTLPQYRLQLHMSLPHLATLLWRSAQKPVFLFNPKSLRNDRPEGRRIKTMFVRTSFEAASEIMVTSTRRARLVIFFPAQTLKCGEETLCERSSCSGPILVDCDWMNYGAGRVKSPAKRL